MLFFGSYVIQFYILLCSHSVMLDSKSTGAGGSKVVTGTISAPTTHHYYITLHYQSTEMYHTPLRVHYSTLHHKSTVPHFSTSSLFNTALKFHSTALLNKFTVSSFSTDLLYYTHLQFYNQVYQTRLNHCTTHLYKSIISRSSTDYLKYPPLQVYYVILLIKCTVPYISTSPLYDTL